MLAIRLPEDLENRLEALAKRTGRTKTFYARQAIERHLEELEDIYDAEQRLIDLRVGSSRTVSLDELTDRYGLED